MLSKHLKVSAYLIILLVLVPYFFCVTGALCQIFGEPRAIILNSEGRGYDMLYVHDRGSYGATWLSYHREKDVTIYTDFVGDRWLISQGSIAQWSINDRSLLQEDRKINGYIYLRYYNVVGKLLDEGRESHGIVDYQDKFVSKGKIYNNGGSEVWK